MRGDTVLGFLQEQKGSAAVLVAIALSCLMGFAALVVNVGLLYIKGTAC